jgi:Spy/CpxP family protein refolding chaperone
MSLKKALLSLIGLLVLGVAAVAQEPAPTSSPAPPTDRQGMREQRMRLRLRRMQQDRIKLGRALQLSDEQQQLRKAIRQRHLEATKTQRNQLFQLRERRRAGSFSEQDRIMAQQLRADMRKAMASARAENMNMLTNEQRERLKTLREQRKQMRQERHQRMMELRSNRPIG